MTSIATQASANPAAALAAQLSALQPGDVLSAIVAKVIDATTLQLLSFLGSIDVQTDVPVAAGTRVELAVAGTQAEPTFTLQSPAADPAAPKFAVAVNVRDGEAERCAALKFANHCPGSIGGARANDATDIKNAVARNRTGRAGGRGDCAQRRHKARRAGAALRRPWRGGRATECGCASAGSSRHCAIVRGSCASEP